MYVCVYMYVCLCRCLGESEEGPGYPGAGVISYCEPPDVGAGSGTWVICKKLEMLELVA